MNTLPPTENIVAEPTPGPWEVVGNPPTEIGAMLDTPDAIIVADTQLMHGDPTPRQLADAHLIAAAPEMLAALKGMLALTRTGVHADDKTEHCCRICAAIVKARAAVAKAEGRES